MKIIGFLIILFVFIPCAIHDCELFSSRNIASSDDLPGYKLVNGGQINTIPNGTIVEGSTKKGGIQPDYIMDLENPLIEFFRKKAKEIGESNLSFWDKIQEIVDIVKFEALEGFSYKDPNYLKMLQLYRDKNKKIPFSSYIYCSAGVCRENALLTHILLTDAGIPSTHIYARIKRKGSYERNGKMHKYGVTEDHGFVVVKHQNKNWIVDPFNNGFNGYLLEDMMSKEGITEASQRAPTAVERDEFRRIIRINNFPKMWIPQDRTPSCLQLIHNFIEVSP